MKKVKILLIVLCCACYAINAQNVNVDSRGKIISIRAVDTNIDTEGSKYINKNFTPITIAQFEDKIYNGRYNAFSGEMEVNLGDNKVLLLDNNTDYEITFSHSKKLYRTENFTNNKGVKKNGFLVVVHETNKSALLKEESITYHKKVEAASSYEKDIPARYIRNKDAYYIDYNNTITYISHKRKDLLKSFPNEASKLKSYIKKNKINLKEEDDLIKIVDYMSNLSK